MSATTQDPINALPPLALPATGADLLPVGRAGLLFQAQISDVMAAPALVGLPNGYTLFNNNGTFGAYDIASTLANAFAAPTPIGTTAPGPATITNLVVTGTFTGPAFTSVFASPSPIGSSAPNSGAFTTLSATSTVSGSGFSTLFASPPSIGSVTPGTGAFTALSGSVLSTGSTTSRTLAARFAEQFNVKDYGATGNGSTDDTASIQAAYTAAGVNGGYVWLPAGNYLVSQPIFCPSNVLTRAAGPTNSVLYASASFNGAISPAWVMLTNKNYATTPPTTPGTLDANIEVYDLGFSYVNLQTVAGGGNHSIRFMGVKGVRIENCNFNYGNDGTAMQACSDTLVQGCIATNITNCCYDHWAGCQDTKVIGNYGSTSNGSGGVFWNADDGTGLRNYVADSALITNNILDNANIDIDTLAQSSSSKRAIIANNRLTNGLIIGRGNLTGVVVSSNVIDGTWGASNDSSAIWFDNDGVHYPADVVVSGNVAINAATASGNEGVIRLDVASGIVANNMVGGTYSCPAYAMQNTAITFVGNVATGSGAYLSGSVITSRTVVMASGAVISDGTGAPTSSTPGATIASSQYLRTDGTTGAHVYVSTGSSTWNAIPGV